MKREYEVQRALNQYADTVRRICFCHLNTREDSEDIFQEVFLKYMLSDALFESPEHEKAWLIRVTLNACNDLNRRLFHRRAVPLDMIAELPGQENADTKEVLSAVLSLPGKYKDVIYLHYYEGYSAAQIGQILGKRENTVYSLLARGREKLRAVLGGEDFEA